MGYVAYMFATAESRVAPMCAAIKPGMRLEQLQEFASSSGLGPNPHRLDGVVRVAETRTVGRFGCSVVMQAGAVLTANYQLMD
jgi:hypothetical protein